MSRNSHRSWLSLMGFVIVVALAAAACGGDDGGALDIESSESDESQEDAEDGEDGEDTAAVDGLVVGTCFDRADDEDRNVVDDVEVPCDAPHDAELIAVFDPPTKTIPEDNADVNADLFPPCVELVESSLGIRVATARVGVAISADGDPGGPYESDANCFVTSPVKGGLIAPLDSGTLDAVSSDYVMLIDLSPGDCFELSVDTAAGFVADCDDPGVLGFVGSFEAADGPFPGNDELQALRDEECARILDGAGASLDGLTLSGTPPSQIAWDFFGFRTVTCDVSPD